MKIKLTNACRIYSPPKWLLKEVKEDYEVINPKYREARRMGRWTKGIDRLIRFYDHKKNHLVVPIGATEEVMQKLTKEQTGFSTYDNRLDIQAKFIFTGKLREFQADAMMDLFKYDIGTLEAPTGSGKTVMGLFAIAYRKQKTLILVHTKDLAYQWIERACEFLDLKPFEIGLIGDGKKQIGRRLTVGMIQTCFKMTDVLSKEFGFVIADEAHRAPSTMFLNILGQLRCKYRLGLSATPYRRDGLNKMIEWYCGPVRHVVSKKKLVEKGHVLQPLFIMKKTEYTTQLDAVNEYTNMLSELTKDVARNKQIVEDIVSYSKMGVCLVLSDRKAHCHQLETYIRQMGLDPLIMTGDTKTKERQTIIDSIGKTHNILIATGQLIGEGFDCKELNMMFICSPIKFSGRVIQYIGRIMRPAKGKDKPIVIDYVDHHIPVLLRSAKGRMRIYGKENIQK